MIYTRPGWYMAMDARGIFHPVQIVPGRRMETRQRYVIYKPTEDELYETCFDNPIKVNGDYKIEYLRRKSEGDLIDEADLSRAEEYIAPAKRPPEPIDPKPIEPKGGWVNP